MHILLKTNPFRNTKKLSTQLKKLIIENIKLANERN